MKLHFQFVAAASQTVREETIRQLREQGARSIRPLFPDDTDPELASVHVVESDDTTGKKLLEGLKSAEMVQYAEVAVGRKLIRPRG